MRKSSRITGLLLALMGMMALLSNLSKPHISALQGSDIVALIACGACFGVGFVGLIGQLRLRGE